MRSTSVQVRGEQVKRWRQRRGLSQRELAFLVRPCSQTTIHLLETGRMTACSEALLLRLARRLDVPFDSLVAEPG
ncbi:helix-turn-helix transcriptional regulator [Angustibacter aerolatus]